MYCVSNKLTPQHTGAKRGLPCISVCTLLQIPGWSFLPPSYFTESVRKEELPQNGFNNPALQTRTTSHPQASKPITYLNCICQELLK